MTPIRGGTAVNVSILKQSQEMLNAKTVQYSNIMMNQMYTYVVK